MDGSRHKLRQALRFCCPVREVAEDARSKAHISVVVTAQLTLEAQKQRHVQSFYKPYKEERSKTLECSNPACSSCCPDMPLRSAKTQI